MADGILGDLGLTLGSVVSGASGLGEQVGHALEPLAGLAGDAGHVLDTAPLDVVVTQLVDQAAHATNAQDAQAAIDHLQDVVDALSELEDAKHDATTHVIDNLHADASDAHGVEVVAFADSGDGLDPAGLHALQAMDDNDRANAAYIADQVTASHDPSDSGAAHVDGADAHPSLDASHDDLRADAHDASHDASHDTAHDTMHDTAHDAVDADVAV